MEPFPIAPIPSANEGGGVHESQRPTARMALCVRLWEYRGPQEKLQDLSWDADPAIAELVRSVAHEAHGAISQELRVRLVIHFGNTLNALSAAKALQVRLLSVPRTPPAPQVVAAAILHGHAETAPSDSEILALASMLVEADSAQILVTEKIYEAVKDIPGFAFNSKPVHQAGERGFSEPIYELLWTDESTYSHVRKTGQTEPAKDLTGASRYQILSELGRGAMGIVYKAHDQVIGRTVALKTISIQQNFADRGELVERLKQEAKAAGGLDHPNIITIYDVGQEKDFVYLSMQFVEGKTLAALLSSRDLPPLTTLLSYAEQICAAVGFAHQRGVIHRDLKPANFMLTKDGVVKVLDFGIAKLGDASLTQTGVVVGTPTYMAPEQATGKKLDQRSDIFSLGTVFYELFTREKPFKGDIPSVLYKLIHEDPAPPSIINPSLPAGIDAMIRKAMAKKPQDRYQSCEEMREALRSQAAQLEGTGTGTIQAPVVRSGEPTPITTRSSAAIRAHTHNTESSGFFGKAVVFALLAAIAAIAVWGHRVKSQTGSLPPSLQKVAGMAQRVKAKLAPSIPVATNAASSTPQEAQAKPDPAATSAIITTQAAPEKNAVDGSSTPSNASADVSAQTGPIATPTATSSPIADASTTVPQQPVQPAPQPIAATQISPPPSEPKSASNAQTTQEAAEDTNSTASEQDESSPSDPTPSRPGGRTARRRFAEAPNNNLRVEGFSRSDVPDLLRKADAAAGSGDYVLARYEYGIVLRLDPRNLAARTGLARVIAARQELLQR